MNRSTPGLPVHHQLLGFTQTHVHWVSDAIQPSLPLSSPFPPALNISQHQGLFKWVSSSHQWPKYWSFSFNISSSVNTQDWFPLGWTGWFSFQTKGLSRVFSNTTVQKHQFFCTQLSSVQLSHPYMTTGKTIALTRRTFVGKVMSLLFNMLSRLVITFLPRSKRLLISWLQSPSAVIWSPPKIKSASWDSTKPLHEGFAWVKGFVWVKNERCGHTNLYSLCLLKTWKFGSSGSSFLPISSRLVLTCCCYCCLRAKLCLSLCDPMDYSTPGFSVHHYLPEFPDEQLPI